MSGEVGPTSNDISFPKEQEYEASNINNKFHSSSPRKVGFLSFRHLNAVALIIILSASGMVNPEDLAFVLFSLFYMYFISMVAFPTLHTSKEPTVFSPQNKLLRIYVLVGAIIGLFLPIAYIVHGIYEGDKKGIEAATPHVFLLASQVFMEGVAFSDMFSLPIGVFVPVCFNTRRVFTIVDWMRSEFSKVEESSGGFRRRSHAGRGLAVANMVFWCFNLFGFLLPVYLPKAFKRYYSGDKV
ncbi:uncharacterized protein LOC122310466 [Carya illinoinensis]|uniref:uncharacterized protein LOC122310466 n=1 Tax=Carya illinoinensis TaxID=32201 RepID=UPI001C721D12|nr:uncharacterized protein LOC122310466 [Carya illinoinensis]